jgi:hypothetical protein
MRIVLFLSLFFLCSACAETYYDCRKDGGTRESCGSYQGTPAASTTPLPLAGT